MRFKKIIRRWMINGLGVVIVLLLILEMAMAMVIRSYYYQQVQNSLYTRVKSFSDVLATYVEQPDFRFEDSVRTFIENFPDKEKVELQFLNTSGKILASSTGFLPDSDILQDYKYAMQASVTDGEDAKGVWVGRNAVGQKVSAVTVFVFKEDGTMCGAIRCLASMENVDGQILLLISVLVLFGIAVLFFVMLSSSYFITSILNPLSEIGETAKKIAQGDYTCRIEKRYDDEVGELCDTINDMAAEIAAAGKMKNEFISSISHELRTPLTAIKGWSETLRKDETQDAALMNKGLEIISSETERLSGMVEELLDFSHMQNSSAALSFEKLDLFAELEEVTFLFRDRAEREGLTLQCVLQEEVIPVKGSRDKLRQVFANILDNAIKYSDDTGTIRVEAATLNGKAQVVISDTGIGISPADLPNIKTKFYRANNVKSGSGIGLAVADEIVKLHDGTLEIESVKGSGTVVTVTLPLYEE